MNDPVVSRLRQQLTAADRVILDAINTRLELVQQLWRHKEQNGLPFVDPDREQWMLSYLTRENTGPLSTEGLAEIYAQILDLTKREAARGEGA